MSRPSLDSKLGMAEGSIFSSTAQDGLHREYVPMNEVLTAQAFAEAMNCGALHAEDANSFFWKADGPQWNTQQEFELPDAFSRKWKQPMRHLVWSLQPAIADSVVNAVARPYFTLKEDGVPLEKNNRYNCLLFAFQLSDLYAGGNERGPLEEILDIIDTSVRLERERIPGMRPGTVPWTQWIESWNDDPCSLTAHSVLGEVGSNAVPLAVAQRMFDELYRRYTPVLSGYIDHFYNRKDLQQLNISFYETHDMHELDMPGVLEVLSVIRTPRSDELFKRLVRRHHAGIYQENLIPNTFQKSRKLIEESGFAPVPPVPDYEI